MSDDFHKSYEFSEKWEGSAFTNHSDDPGGATKYGISYRFLKGLPLFDSDINKDGVLNWYDVKDLKREDAMILFKKYFWDKMRLEFLPWPLNCVMYDTGINLGRSRTVKFLQVSVMTIPDGILGPVTLDSTHRFLSCFPNGGAELLSIFILDRRESHYLSLAYKTEWADSFIKGWLNRTKDLKKFIGVRL